MILTVELDSFANSWPIWIFPSAREALEDEKLLRIVDQLDKRTLKFLTEGGSVLLSPPKGSLKPQKGGNIGLGFSSIFWNTAWTRGQKPHTLGILCDPEHPSLAEFPTEYHSNWQWWDAMSHADAMILDEFSPNLKPIVRVIDDWFTNRRLGLIFEAKVGKGKLIISGIDLLNGLENRPEAQQLLFSLKKYMLSDRFDPKVELMEKEVLGLFN